VAKLQSVDCGEIRQQQFAMGTDSFDRGLRHIKQNTHNHIGAYAYRHYTVCAHRWLIVHLVQIDYSYEIIMIGYNLNALDELQYGYSPHIALSQSG